MHYSTLPAIALAAAALSAAGAQAQTAPLQGTVIGTELSFDYASNSSSTTVNTREMAFDGDLNTFFASDARDHTWVGLDLGAPHVITAVAWSPRNDGNVGSGRVVLGLFEGANSPDFSDATPLYIISEPAPYGELTTAEVKCPKGFRYVRYSGPSDARCNIAEVQFLGTEGEGEDRYATLTNLPTVVINTVNYEEPQGKNKSDEKKSTVNIIDTDGKLLSAPGTLRLRGNASMQFKKKPYRIKFDKKQKPLDAPAKAKKWTLINNYGDKTLMRNLLAWQIARTFPQVWTPYGTPVDVVVNGEYKGCYQLCDQVEVKEGRMPLNETEVEDLATTAPEEIDYFMEIDGYAGYTEPFAVPENWESAFKVPVTLKSPDPDDLLDAGTDEPFRYIKRQWQLTENSIIGAGFPDNGYRDLFDVDSFLVHFLIGEVTANPDVFWSTYIYKRAGDNKIYTGPEWDFDLAFGNDYRTYGRLFLNRWSYSLGTPAGCNDNNGWSNHAVHDIVGTLIDDDPANLPRAKAIYEKACKNGLTADELCDFIDRTAADLDASQRLNFLRWDILNKAVHMNPGETLRSSYQQYIDLLKQFVTRRLDYLDKTSFRDVVSSGDDEEEGGGDDSVDSIDGDNVHVAVSAGCVTVSGADAVTLHSLQGTTLFTDSRAEGRQIAIRADKGIYILVADGKARTIAIP